MVYIQSDSPVGSKDLMIIGLQCMLKVTYQWPEPEPKHDVYECLVTFENSSVYYGRHA